MSDKSPSRKELQSRAARPKVKGRERGGPPGGAAPPDPAASALDSVSEGFVILDRDWRVVFVNAAAERFSQRSRAELLGQGFWELFPEAGSRRFGFEYRRAVAENVPVHFEEFYPEPLNKWYEVRAYPSPEGLSIFFRDVTERRKVEDALRLSEERYRSLFNSMAQGFAVLENVCDENGVPCDSRFLEINPAFETLTGVKRDEVIGRLGSDVFPADHMRWVETYGAVALTGESITVDHYSPAIARHYDVLAYRPAPRQFAIIFHDITERKRLEEEQRILLTKYTVLFDSFPLGISVTDSAGSVREINRTASRLLGAPPESVLSHRVGVPQWRIIRPDGSPMPPDEFASVRAMKEQGVVEDVETGIARPGEDVIWISVSAAPIPLEGYGLVITYGDISRRRRAEAKLAEEHCEAVAARARLEAAMEALPTGLVILDAGGGHVRSNAAFERIWGVGRPVPGTAADYRAYKARWLDTGRDVLPEEWASARAIRHGEAVVGQLVEIERFDGGRAFVLNSAAPIFDENRGIVGCAVAIQDISRLVEAERALERSEAALRAANEDLESANAELRRSNETLEARVAARTAAVAKRTAQLQALALDLTRAEERERQRIAQVIHDDLQQLLSLARINLGMALGQVKTKSIQRRLGELDGLIAESLDITRSLTAELSPGILHRSGLAAALRWLGRWFENRFGLKVEVEAGEDVELDEEPRVMLFRAARELLVNVAKHARVESARVSLSQTADGRVRIVVSDQGAGFDPATMREWDGTEGSFGLFSLRERLELLGGQLEVDSAPGRGASFTVIGPPPRRMESGTPASPKAAPPEIAGRHRTGVRRGAPARRKKR